ncbi:MAG TPA: hypothetical protein H9886_03920 [Candidatus Faecalicoccus intestinipullorum]|nr:hypothetical protein [Candidatus Faecalicoccus intestinipullorum]
MDKGKKTLCFKAKIRFDKLLRMIAKSDINSDLSSHVETAVLMTYKGSSTKKVLEV